MINRHYEEIVSIICDHCIDEEFRPDLENELDRTELSLVWEQAEGDGWTQRLVSGDLFQYCPKCSQHPQEAA